MENIENKNEQDDSSYEVKLSTEWGPFAMVPHAFLNDYLPFLNSATTKVYLILIKYAGNSDNCFPGYSKIAKSCGLGRTSVSEALKALISLNIIKKTRVGKGCTNRYLLILPKKWRKINDESDVRSQDSSKVMSAHRTSDVRSQDLGCPLRRSSNSNKIQSTKIQYTKIQYPSIVSPINDLVLPLDNGKLHQGEAFEIFYKFYPRKVSKLKAKKAWDKIKPDQELFTKIMVAVEGSKKSDQWTTDDGKFIPHPSTWLNGHRWEDEIKITKCKNGLKQNALPSPDGKYSKFN